MPMLQSAVRHYRLSALVAQRAVAEARKAKRRGTSIAAVVITHQATQASLSQTAIAEMLAEQKIDAPAQASLNALAFTTSSDVLTAMLAKAGDVGFDRVIASIVQDAGRTAESVSTAVRPNIGHVRTLTPPSCSRCAVLAGRVYRYSDGFLRHPHCDCTMAAVRLGDTTHAADPLDLLRRGLITDLSKADAKALADGADFGHVVNARGRNAGLRESGRVLARAGRPTPEGIYRMTSSQPEAVALLAKHGYLL